MIQIKNVTKSFGEKKALDDVCISIKEGTVHGIIGENGAGKSTLIQCLVGVYEADSGQIQVVGENVYENNTIKSQIGYVADRNQFFKGYTVKQMMQFFSLTYDTFEEEKFWKYNEVFKLQPSVKVKHLSKGMQMRLALMLALSINPKVLVLDEPTSGLDVIAKKQVLDMILEEVETRNMTVVISSHHLTELEKICDSLTIMHQGRVTYQASIDTIKESVKKLQVVWEQKSEDKLEDWEEVIHIDTIGSVDYIITDQYGEMFMKKLKQNGASMVEPIGLNLEEVFLYTAAKRHLYH